MLDRKESSRSWESDRIWMYIDLKNISCSGSTIVRTSWWSGKWAVRRVSLRCCGCLRSGWWRWRGWWAAARRGGRMVLFLVRTIRSRFLVVRTAPFRGHDLSISEDWLASWICILQCLNYNEGIFYISVFSHLSLTVYSIPIIHLSFSLFAISQYL